MPWAAAIGAAAGLGSSIIGASQASASREEALRLINESVNDLKAVGIPDEDAMRISLEKYKSQGVLTPELEQDIMQGRSEMEGISTDPRLKDAQMSALDELRRVGEGGGMRLTDKANLESTLSDIDQQERGSREAILADKAQRGPVTGGDALAAQLLNQQGAAQRKREEGLRVAGNAEDAALQAILQSGQLAGSMQGQEFSQKADVAKAQDLINQMNTEAQRGVQERNIQSKNAAAATNLQQKQNLANSNVDLTNAQEQYNKSLGQKRYDMELGKATALANARGGQASMINQGGKDDAAMYGKIGGGVAQLGQSYWDKQASAEERDKDRAAGFKTYA